MKKTFPFLILLILVCGPVLAGGQIRQDCTMSSQILGRTLNYSIYLPQGYDTDSRSYPVLYLLHGAGDDHRGWSQQGEVKQIADKEIAEGRATAMIIVMPNAKDVGYANRFDGSADYEDMFFRELIPHIEATYRTLKEREYRAVAGLSMGGNGSLLYALHYPDYFSSCYAMSAAVRSSQDMLARERDQKPSEKLKTYWQQNSVLDLASALPDGQRGKLPRITIDCGDDDFLYKGNALLHILLREREIPHEYRVRDGGHTWTYWRTGLVDALAYASVSFRRS